MKKRISESKESSLPYPNLAAVHFHLSKLDAKILYAFLTIILNSGCRKKKARRENHNSIDQGLGNHELNITHRTAEVLYLFLHLLLILLQDRSSMA